MKTRESGLTLVELLVVLALATLVIGFSGTMYFYMARSSILVTESAALQQDVQAVRSFIIGRIRFAGHVQVVENGDTPVIPMDRRIWVEEGRIILADEGRELEIGGGNGNTLTLHFENHSPMLFLRVEGSSRGGQTYSIEGDVLIHGGLTGGEGQKIYFTY